MINLTSQDWLTFQNVFQSSKGVLPYFNFEDLSISFQMVI